MGLLERLLRRKKRPGGKQLRASCVQGPGDKKTRRDVYAVQGLSDPEAGVFAAVADGAGELENGRAAALLALERMSAGVRGLPPEADVPEVLLRSLEQAGREIFRVLSGGATASLACLYLRNGQLHWLSAGSCGAYLLRDGELVCLCAAHTKENDLLALQLEKPVPAREKPGPDALSPTALPGGRQPLRAERSLRPLPLEKGDALLLCTPGVWQTLPPEALKSALESAPGRGCALLRDLIGEKNRPDMPNFTAVILRYNGPGKSEPAD